MKLFSYLVAALVAGMTYSLPAEAMQISTLADPSSASSPTTLYDEATGDFLTGYTISSPMAGDTLTGYLSGMTKIVLTYSYNTAAYAYLSGGAVGVTDPTEVSFAAATGMLLPSGFTSASIPGTYFPSTFLIISEAALTALEGTVTITNYTSNVVQFQALLQAVLAGCGPANVSWAVSSVPLPPAAFLFFAGTAGLFGVRKRKRA
ncbi:MAG: hypothetical protein PHE27_09500 [Alphaproteobacteria bacterium]|nr:hypothetical protein [Alphaproteobacteria bacterium]